MTTVKLIKIPTEWEVPDEDGDVLADSFQVGMILDVSIKSNGFCRVYTPEDVNLPLTHVEYIDGDRINL
jgi:hypothetical protein